MPYRNMTLQELIDADWNNLPVVNHALPAPPKNTTKNTTKTTTKTTTKNTPKKSANNKKNTTNKKKPKQEEKITSLNDEKNSFKFTSKYVKPIRFSSEETENEILKKQYSSPVNFLPEEIEKERKKQKSNPYDKITSENIYSELNTPDKVNAYVKYQSKKYGTQNDKPNEEYEWKLVASDGTDFGTVSWDAMRHVYDNTLSSYTPKNKKEEDIINSFAHYKVYDLGGKIGKVSYNDINKLSKGNFEGTFDNENIKKNINAEKIKQSARDENPEYYNTLEKYANSANLKLSGEYPKKKFEKQSFVDKFNSGKAYDFNSSKNNSLELPFISDAEILFWKDQDPSTSYLSVEAVKKMLSGNAPIMKADTRERIESHPLYQGNQRKSNKDYIDIYNTGIRDETPGVDIFSFSEEGFVPPEVEAVFKMKTNNTPNSNNSKKRMGDYLTPGEKRLLSAHYHTRNQGGNEYTEVANLMLEKAIERHYSEAKDERVNALAKNKILGTAEAFATENLFSGDATLAQTLDAVKGMNEKPASSLAYILGQDKKTVENAFGISDKPTSQKMLGDVENPWDLGNTMFSYTTSLEARNKISEDIKKEYGSAAKTAYDFSLVLGDIGVQAGIGTVAGPWAATVHMYNKSAATAMNSIRERGGDDGQILVGGVAYGLLSVATEKMSFDQYTDPELVKKFGTEFFKTFAKTGAEESKEEIIEGLGSLVLDSVIMGDKSESKLRERNYVIEGYTAEEARRKVFEENALGLIQEGAMAFFAGGTAGSVSAYTNTKLYDSEIKTSLGNYLLQNEISLDAVKQIGTEIDSKASNKINLEIAKKSPDPYTIGKTAENIIKESITKNASLPGVVKVIGAIEGRSSDYYTSNEAIDTANAVLKMTNGTATKADYALIEKSEGARTVVLSAEGTKAWDSLKTEADRRMRSAEYGMRSDATSSTAKAVPLPLQGEGLDMRSKRKSATISDGEIYSNGKKVTIDNTSKVAGNVVLDEESYNFRKVNKKGYDVIQTMAKDLEKIVQYVDGLTDSEGKQLDGVITSEGIFINTQSKNPTRWAATHEFSHRMKQTGGKMWQRYQDYVISHLKETGKYEERYNLKKGAYAESEIDEEIASDYIGEMFDDVKELSNFIRKNRRDAFGIRNAYYKVLDKLGLLSEKKKAQAMWAKAYREAMKNVKDEVQNAEYGMRSESKKSKSGTRTVSSYDFSKSFAEQIDDYLKGNFPKNDTLIVGGTDKVYLDIGFNALPVTIAQGHVKTALDKNSDADHYLGETGIKQLPDALRKPVAIIRSATHPQRVVSLLPIQINGKTVIVPFEIDGSGRTNNKRIDSNAVTSVYGKGNAIKQLQKALKDESAGKIEVFYWNKKEAITLLQRAGLQLPGGLPQDGFVHSIREKGANINTKFENVTQSQQFKRWFGKSKIVNKDGTPLIMYHGTSTKNGEFYVFDYDKASKRPGLGLKNLGKGNYFTSTELSSNSRYDRILPVYLSVKSPFVVKNDFTEEITAELGIERESSYDDIQKAMIDAGYDGVVKYDSEGNVAIAVTFDSTQVKSATDNIGTFDESNPDIRYSVSGTRVEESSVSEVSESLKEENARLRAELENIHLQLDQAEGKGLDQKAIKKAAENIKKAYFSKIKTSELHQELAKLYRLMASKDATANEISDRINEISERVIENAYDIIENIEYRDLLYTIKNTKIQVPEADRASFADGYEHFRKSNMGKIKLVNDGYALDALWEDLLADYPYFFSEDLKGSEERLNRILEIREEFQPVEDAVYKTEEEKQKAITALANDIMESFFEIPEGGDGKYIFYDKRAAQAKKDFETAEENYIKAVKKVNEKLEKMVEMYEYEINRIEERHEAELDRRDKESAKKLAKSEEKTEKLRDRYDREKVKKGIDRYFNYLFKMYSDPTDARHIPENLRRDVGNILERINFETKHTDKLKEKGEESALSIRLDGIAEVFRRIQSEAWGVISTDDSPTIDAALRQELEELISEIPVDESGNSKRLEDMTTEELKAVYEMLMAVHHAVTKSNEAFSNRIKENINENAEKVDRKMENVRSKKKGSGEKIEGKGGKIRSAYNSLDKFVNADLYKPWDFFHKLGGTMEELYMATRDTFDDYIKNLQTFYKKLGKATEKINVKKLSKVETIKLLGGAEIKLTRGQMIGIVATYKRPAGRTHILEGGIVTNRPWKDENGHERTGVAPIKLNEHDVGVITEMLTSEETDMMFALVDFMSKECSKWGNETSVKLLGYEKYGEGWYYPIKVWDGSLDKSAAKKGEKNPTNKSFTKKLTPNAGNAIEINDFLDVVIEHVNSMNMYSTLALPLLDMERILNHKGEGTASKDVREAIRRTYGKSAEEYIYKLIRNVNGMTQKVEKDLLDKLIANTKKAHIAFKTSVFLKQGTSIVRVLQVMDPIYLRSGIKSFTHPKETIREMQENVPIAFWKSLGFRDPAMGTDIKNALLGTESVTDKLGFGLYGLADDFTWGVIYNAVKTEVKSKNKGIDVNSEEFKQKVVKRFNYIIDRTQVVDSPFHSAQIMKSNNPLTNLTTSHMSEPLTTLNLYRTDLQDATNDAIEKGTPTPVVTKFIRSTNTFLLSSLLLAIAGALPKLLKEDPEDKYDDEGKKISGWERFQSYVKEGFAEEANPFNLVPYLNRVIDIWEGWEQKDWSFEAIEDVVNSIKNFTTEEGQKKSWYAKIKDFSSATAVIFGMPYGNAVKEIEGIAKTVMHMSAGEYGDYLITKSKWNVKDPKNKSKFMKYYENAIINGHSEEAAEIFSDYYGVENNEEMKVWIKETARLYKATGDDKIFYNDPKGEFKFGGEEIKLEGKQHEKFVKEVNGNYIKSVKKLIESDYYKNLSDNDKIKMLATLKTRVENQAEMKYYPINVLDNNKSDEVLSEINDLYINTGTNLLAELPASEFSADGEQIQLNGKEYEKYVDESYENLWELAYEFVKSNEYSAMTDEEKTKGFKNAWSLAQAIEKFEFDNDYKLSDWQKEVYTGEKTFTNSFVENLNDSYYDKSKKDWKDKNFNIDESKHSSEEIKSMLAFEEQASAFYVSHEMGIPYKEEDYRAVQVYNDYLSDVMSLEEFAAIKAYAQKTAAKTDGKDSLTKDELKMVIDATSYSNDVKAALFEAISRKGTINPYNGYKVGSEQQFVVLTHSPTKDKKSDVVAPKTEPKTENEKTPKAFPEGYTNENDFYVIEPQDIEINRGNSNGYKEKNQTTKKYVNYNTPTTPATQKTVTIKYDASKYTSKQVSRFKQVENDANSYYNSPRLSSYKGSNLRHMNVFETRLKSYIDLDTYAKIRAEAFGDNDNITEDALQTYIENLDYDTEVKAALFEAIGEEDWENPFEE